MQQTFIDHILDNRVLATDASTFNFLDLGREFSQFWALTDMLCPALEVHTAQ